MACTVGALTGYTINNDLLGISYIGAMRGITYSGTSTRDDLYDLYASGMLNQSSVQQFIDWGNKYDGKTKDDILTRLRSETKEFCKGIAFG